MVRCLRRAALSGALVALLVSIPTPAAAQLGGLAKRAAKKAVEERVEAALPFTPKDAPEFNDRVLEMDEGLVDRLIRGFETEISLVATAPGDQQRQAAAHEQAMKEYEIARAAFDRESARWQACADTFRTREMAAAAANEAQMERLLQGMDDEELERYAEDLAVRGEKLAREIESGRSDAATQRAWMDYQRELQVFTLEQQRRALLVMSGAMAESRRAASEDPRLAEACGRKPEPPAEPPAPPSGPEEVLVVQGAAAAGLSRDQYAIMRERVVHWWQQERRPSGMGYSAAEIRVLESKGDALDDVFERMVQARVPF